MVIGNAVGERQENTVINEGTKDRDFTVSTSSNDPIVNVERDECENFGKVF